MMETRATNSSEEHIALAKKAYAEGQIEADEMEVRIGHALEGRAVLAPDVPLFDRPKADRLTKVRG
jgi:hypothetical protein